MWYVIQTITRKEEELVSMIRSLLPQTIYESCFIIRAEWMKRLGGEWQIQTGPLFPGYVFIDTDCPKQVFQELRGLPRFTRLLGNDRFEFTAVEPEEHAYLEQICDKKNQECPDGVAKRNYCRNSEYLVRLTEAETAKDGTLKTLHGPLEYFAGKIETVNLHKRYAVAKVTVGHQERTVLFGIRLKRD